MLLSSQIYKILFTINIQEPDQKKDIEIRLKFALDKISEFYGSDVHPQQVYLNLIYSRDEFNKKIGRETPDWMMGFADKNIINLISRSVIRQRSSHSQDYFNKLLIHELVHIFTSEINDKALMWLDEGLALKIAGQEKKVEVPKDDWEYFVNNNGVLGQISYQNFSDHSGYRIAYWLTNELLNNFDKKDVMGLLKINPEQDNVDKKISEILKISSGQIINLGKKCLRLI